MSHGVNAAGAVSAAHVTLNQLESAAELGIKERACPLTFDHPQLEETRNAMDSSSEDSDDSKCSLPSAPPRRQGIFWILTCPDPNAVCESLSSGNLPPELCFATGQKEKGNSAAYIHWQLCVAFTKKVSLAAVTSLFGRGIHAELSRSEAAIAYCNKEDTRLAEPFTLGTKPIRRNSKTDWESVWTAAQSGDLMQIPANVRVVSYRTLRAIQSDFSIPKGIDRRVDVFWGRTGTGKSRRAWDEAGEGAYSKCPRSKWWDGYQDQEHVVLDEFRGSIDVAHLLRWFDRYPVRVEVKGSTRPLNANRIWVTSNVNPLDWYPELDVMTRDALIRRLNIEHFP